MTEAELPLLVPRAPEDVIDDDDMVFQFYQPAPSLSDSAEDVDDSSVSSEDAEVPSVSSMTLAPARARNLLRGVVTAKAISKDAVDATVVCTERLLQELMLSAEAIMRRNQKQTVTYDMIAEAVHTNSRFALLADTVPLLSYTPVGLKKPAGTPTPKPSKKQTIQSGLKRGRPAGS